MARVPVNVRFEFDDSTNQLTIIGQLPPPPPPAGIAAFTLGAGQGFELTVNITKKAVATNPEGFYPVPNTVPVEWRRVEYINGAWQMPGTVWTP